MAVSKQKVTLIVVLISILFVGGCSSIGGLTSSGSGAKTGSYYTGTQGVNMAFNNLPTTVYYYGTSDVANGLTFGVDVRNNGGSYSRGGVYLAGFDPTLINFENMDIQHGTTGACGISILSLGFGDLGGMFACEGFGVSTGGGSTSVRIDDLTGLINGISTRFGGAKWFDSSAFRLSFASTTGNGFAISLNGMTDDQLRYFQHGRLFIAMLSGIDYNRNFGREFLLQGNTPELPGGESQYLEYKGTIQNWPPGANQLTQHLQLTSCYQYTTFADPMVCIDPSPYSDNRKVCSPKSSTWGSGNGAPVTITSIEQENTPKTIIFRVNVKNSGSGMVVDPGKLEKCSPYYPGRFTSEDKNVVYLGDVRVGNVGLKTRSAALGMTCSPEVIRLDPKTQTGSTTCMYPVEFSQLKSAYETPLIVELWYGYSQVLQRDVTIKRV